MILKREAKNFFHCGVIKCSQVIYTQIQTIGDLSILKLNAVIILSLFFFEGLMLAHVNYAVAHLTHQMDL